MENMHNFWLILGVIFLFLEMLALNYFFCTMGSACLITSIFAYLNYDNETQILIFFILMVVLTFLTYFIINPLYLMLSLKGDRTKSKLKNSPRENLIEIKELRSKKLIGKRVNVTEKIQNCRNEGLVKIERKNCRAVSKKGTVIEKGKKVFIKQVVINAENPFLLVDTE